MCGLLILTLAALPGCGGDTTARADSLDGAPAKAGKTFVRPEVREQALAAARVWMPPAVPIGAADLKTNPGGDQVLHPDRDLDCRFLLDPVGGTTPKFYCQASDGRRVKVKYGSGNPEIYAEVAATRLLNAIGFGADNMFVVRKVTCAGCPAFPFQGLRCYHETSMGSACFARGLDPRSAVDFPIAVVEQRLPGRVIEATEDQGWAWYELDRVRADRGGSTRAEVDALRLMAIVLAHWDNKAANQRLVCPPREDRPDGACGTPRAIIQDLGATFGPTKLDLNNWRGVQVWRDPRACTVSMKHLPWGGATFPDASISEEGRQFLLGLLEQLSAPQLKDLFEGARVPAFDQVAADARRAESWVRAFGDKVQQIRAAGPCPASGGGQAP